MMANEKIVKKILEEAAKPNTMRYKVSNKIKNYPIADQEDAINYVLKNGYVDLAVEETNLRGRNPVIVSITEKGRSALSVLLSFDDRDTKWKMTV